MRYRFITHKPILKFDGEHLTKEDFHYLYVGSPEKNSIPTIANIFNVDPLDVYVFATKQHIGIRKEDSSLYKSAEALEHKLYKNHQNQWDKVYKNKKKEETKELWQQAEKIYGKNKPNPIEHKVGDKIYIDRDLVNFHNRNVEAIYKQLNDKGTRKNDINVIRSVDLSAMRLHRGLDMYKFSNVSGIPYKQIVYYEKTRGVIIPKGLSDIYFKALNISRSEFRKILECLSGKRRDMFEEERREIPDSVREYVWKRDNGKCKECGEQKYLHFHHIRQYSQGGKHEAKNLKLLCVSCHAEVHHGEKGYHMLKAQADKLMGGEKNWVNSN